MRIRTVDKIVFQKIELKIGKGSPHPKNLCGTGKFGRKLLSKAQQSLILIDRFMFEVMLVVLVNIHHWQRGREG